MERVVIASIALIVGIPVIVRADGVHPKPAPPIGRTVEICTDMIADAVLLAQARLMASSAFANLGLKIAWHSRWRSCRPGSIVIGLRESTPDSLLPGALGYALAFEGTFGEVFLDRIKKCGQPDLAPRLLAHALTHEITHLLQGSDSHSDRGLMKKVWDSNDYHTMTGRFLEFTAADVFLLRNGLDARPWRVAAALSTKTSSPARLVP